MSLPTLKLHDNGKYYVHWSDGRRSRRESTGTGKISAAKAYLAQFLLNGAGSDQEQQASITVEELWRAYDSKHVEKVAAPASIRYAFAKLLPHFGPRKIQEVDQRLVEAYERLRTTGKLGPEVKRATVRKELVALRAALNWAADPKRDIISRNALKPFDLPPEGEARDRWLRPEEITRLTAAARAARVGDRLSRVERFLAIALETAARKTAILELTWDRVDFQTGVIHYDVPGRRTTKKRRASVPISKTLRPILERAHEERQGDLVMDHGGEIWPQLQSVVWASGIAGEQPKRKRLSVRAVAVMPADAPADAKPTMVRRYTYGKPPATGVSPHVMRHTAATHMARRGVPLWIIAKVLGNSLTMVEKVYAKHSPEDLRSAVNLISTPTELVGELAAE